MIPDLAVFVLPMVKMVLPTEKMLHAALQLISEDSADNLLIVSAQMLQVILA